MNHLETRIPGLGPVHVVNTHLAPSAPAIRVQEAQTFGLFKHPTIAMGDWNARATNDPAVPPTLERSS
ncbi:hypothetical protein ETD86_29530 [Nonomuraea turkmeniaca]|uniref:Endonuclease/exonuclease/phosphatase domain-containing protein n=1 Tax=Nonomuraea turkmeniaca TaxID=103838 RepID=A0A5S4FAI2_9ACTN|nr:hypothetical protein [Nonomuraea turkmeniaca]TMR14089.1 hypothetical protein ETD86_29530 [Nonomuraea turkmeniaca]